jgi:ascorbate-specific PTS system EIIC-type component UlaA
MRKDEYLKREIIYSAIFILIGIIALVGFIIGFRKPMMFGIAIGFIPTGVGMLLIYQKAKKHEEFSRNLKLEKEERNIYINSKAGSLAFWVSYWYIVIASVFSNIITVSMQRFTIYTLIFMPVIYFLFVAIYHRKY